MRMPVDPGIEAWRHDPAQAIARASVQFFDHRHRIFTVRGYRAVEPRVNFGVVGGWMARRCSDFTPVLLGQPGCQRQRRIILFV